MAAPAAYLLTNGTDVPLHLFLEMWGDEAYVPPRTTVEVHFYDIENVEGITLDPELIVIFSNPDRIRPLGPEGPGKALWGFEGEPVEEVEPGGVSSFKVTNERWQTALLSLPSADLRLPLEPDSTACLEFPPVFGDGLKELSWDGTGLRVDGDIRKVWGEYYDLGGGFSKGRYERWPKAEVGSFEALRPPRTDATACIPLLLEPVFLSWKPQRARGPLPLWIRAALVEAVPGNQPRLRWHVARLREPVTLPADGEVPRVELTHVVLRSEHWNSHNLPPLPGMPQGGLGVEVFAARGDPLVLPAPVSIERDLVFVTHALAWFDIAVPPEMPSLRKQEIDRLNAGTWQPPTYP